MDYQFLALVVYFAGVLLELVTPRAAVVVRYIGAGLFLLSVLVVALSGGYRAT